MKHEIMKNELYSVTVIKSLLPSAIKHEKIPLERIERYISFIHNTIEKKVVVSLTIDQRTNQDFY